MRSALTLFFLSISLFSLAQGNSDSVTFMVDSSSINPPPTDSDLPDNISGTIVSVSSAAQSFQFLLSLMVIVFGAIVVSLQVYLATKKVINSEHIFKCLIITLIIIGSLLLITAGYSNSQINGITGLLGSIAGYLLANLKTNNKGEEK